MGSAFYSLIEFMYKTIIFLSFLPYFYLCSFLLRFDFILKHLFVIFVHLGSGNNHLDKQTVAPFTLNTLNAYDKFLSEILKNLTALLIFFVSSNNLDVLGIF